MDRSGQVNVLHGTRVILVDESRRVWATAKVPDAGVASPDGASRVPALVPVETALADIERLLAGRGADCVTGWRDAARGRDLVVRAVWLASARLTAIAMDTPDWAEADVAGLIGVLQLQLTDSATGPALVIADMDGTIVGAGGSLYGDAGEGSPVVGRNIATLLSNPDLLCDLFSDLFECRQFARTVRWGDEPGALEATVNAAMLPDTNRFVIVCRSVQEAEGTSADSGAVEDAMGHVASMVSHELNNVLGAVAGYCHLLRASITDPVAARDLQSLERAGEEAALIIRQLSAVGRPQALTPSPVDLSWYVRDRADAWQTWLGDEWPLQIAASSDTAGAVVDPFLLEQLVLSLLGLIRSVLPDGGAIALSTSPSLDQEARLQIGWTGDAGRWTHGQWDARQPGRSPLALRAAHAWLMQANGRLVFTQDGSCATCDVMLPASQDRPAASTEMAAELTVSRWGRGRHALIVEDTPALRELARRVLTDQGFRVTALASGSGAIELMDEDGSLDLVLTDIMLPGVDGWQVGRTARQRFPQCVVIYASGDIDESRRGRPDDSATFLPKPFTPRQLMAAVARLLATTAERET